MWFLGALVSNIGTWMQRTAQDWLVLTQLTHRNATAVGVVMALQFGPQLLLLPLTGYVADHFDRRRLLLLTQSVMGVLALVLGLLTLSGLITLWQVYVFALLLGCVNAFDFPVRQTIISELVSERELSNAVSLNSASFNMARMVGPAVAGILIASLGSGWVFIFNAGSFGAMIGAVLLLRSSAAAATSRIKKNEGRLTEGFRYVWMRSDIRAILVMFLLIGMFGLNFPIFISTMSVNVFHVGAQQFGFLTSMMAAGSVAGALLSARRSKPAMLVLVAGSLSFGLACACAAVMPTYFLFALFLVIVGVAAQTFTTTANSLVQLSAEPEIRGRVVAILLAVAFGGTPVGAPITGWVADAWGPRWSLGVAAAAGIIAAAVGIFHSKPPGHLK